MKSASSGSGSGRCAATVLPEATKALFTWPTARCRWRTAPSFSKASQSASAPACGSTTRPAAGAAAFAAPPDCSARATRTAERTTLSPITSTVTVAPLTISGIAIWVGPAEMARMSAPR